MLLRPVLLAIVGLSLAAPCTTAQILSREELVQLREHARRDSCDAALQYYLGRALTTQNQWDAADSAFQRAVAIDPQLASAWVAAGLIQNGNRRYWDRLKRGGDSTVQRERRRRDAMLRRGLLIDPLAGLDELPLNARPHSSESFAMLDEWRSAALRRTGNLDSVPPGLLLSHALAAARDVRYAPAIADLRAVLRIAATRVGSDSADVRPTDVTYLRYTLAVLYHRAGDRETAAQLYREVLAEDLGNYMAHVQLARIHEHNGDTAAALRERRAAADANPEDHSLLRDLGVALHRAGQLAQAEEVLRQARALNRRDPQVHYRLGVLLDERGSRDSARTALETFLRVAPSGWATRIADARQRLERAR